MKTVYIYSKVFLKSGNIVKTTLKPDIIEGVDVESEENLEHIKQSCKTLSKIYIGEAENYEKITWGNLDVMKGKFAFRAESVEAAIVTYEIIDE